MGSGASVQSSTVKEPIPSWVYTVKIPPEYSADKLGPCSDGMGAVGPNTVIRNRPGVSDSDGARWTRGFTSGKHTFEIVFPMAHRGYQATVGVSTEEAPLYSKGRVPLVGFNKHSWGICLRTRKTFHKNSQMKDYPSAQMFLPDKMYMYLDADAGTLMFGSDLDYYGPALSGIPRTQPLYPTVSATIQGATITVVYRGKGDDSAIGPPPPCVVPAAPQMMSPQMTRNEPPPPPPPTVISNKVPSAPASEAPAPSEKPAEDPPAKKADAKKDKKKDVPATEKEEEAKENPAPAAAAAAAPESEAKPETEAEVKPEAEAKTEAETNPEEETKPKAGSKTEEEAKPEAEADAKPEAESKPEGEGKQESEVKEGEEANPEAETKPEA